MEGNNKIIVMYQSKYGSTQKYAAWLAESLSCEMVEITKVSVDNLKHYDVIVLGGGIYASGVAGISFLKKNYKALKEKKIVTFAVGASPYDEEAMQAIKERNYKNISAEVPCFYCRGAWHEESMSLKDKMLCTMLKKVVSRKDPKDYQPWEAALMEAIGSQHDWTDKAYLKPILKYING